MKQCEVTLFNISVKTTALWFIYIFYETQWLAVGEWCVINIFRFLEKKNSEIFSIKNEKAH